VTPSNNCFLFIKSFEPIPKNSITTDESNQIFYKPFLDATNTPTIGWGTTYYPDGTRVTMDDIPITPEYANHYFNDSVISSARAVNAMIKASLMQNQFDAVVSLVYNIGSGNFLRSNLLSAIKENPIGANIYDIFVTTCISSKGIVLNGLKKRRILEANMYINGNYSVT
jgi:lysozyme